MVVKRDIKTPQELKELLKELFKGKRVKVYLFGSRAKGNHSQSSDFDLAFLPKGDRK